MSIDSSLQNNPHSLREIRIFVETLFNLKQETIAYNEDGTIKGTKEISASTLSDLIKKTSVPLGRPVLNVKKKLYSKESDNINPSEETEVYFEDFDDENETFQSSVSSTMEGVSGKIVREWDYQQTYLKKYLSPWSSNRSPFWRAFTDTDFFRISPPDVTDGVFLNTIEGYVPTGDKLNPVVFDKLPFGMERALSTTYRKGSDRKKQVLLPEESASMNSYLLFPIRLAIYLGSTRTSSIAIDSGRSQMKKDTMKGILLKTGGPTNVGTSNDLVLLDVQGTTLSNIPLADYIEGMSVPALGIGDTFMTLDQYGMNQLELTPDIVNVLVSKIELYQSQLLSTLAKLGREINVQETEQNPFLDTTIFEDIRNQPILLDDIIEYERTNPSLAQSDIGKIAYLMKHHPVYFQVAVGNNSTLIAKEVLVANNQRYSNTLMIHNIIEKNILESGEMPKPNTCQHVKNLVSVRRIRDDTERFKYFIDFFKKYQGSRDNNWINCNLCKEHLICIHERLQMQAYLNIKEKDLIQKEIILKFSGGQFQGKYICRNCGQPIRDIDFDNNMEFDDNGKPKSGNAVLEDDTFEEELNNATNIPIAPSQKKELQLNEEEIQCYDIVVEIASRVGITLDNSGIRTVLHKIISFINKFPKRDVYKTIQAKRVKDKRPPLPDYDIAISRNIITAAATFLLLEIQTKIPSYVVKHTMRGCTPGFNGYPLEDDTKQGIEYIGCAVASIRRNDAPWNQTGFPADKDKRQKGMIESIENVLKQIIGDNIIQSDLSEKRKYLSTKVDVRGPKDMIPATFLPEQIIVTPEDAAKDVIVEEVATGNVKLWIRQAHVFAKKTANIVYGSLIETTCCLANIEAPGTFWNDLPPLDKRNLTPNKQGQFLLTEFNPRATGSDVVEPDSELYYRIFLKYCFEGTRMGYQHEPGLTNACMWCGFQFPTIPSVMDSDTEGKAALASQNIATGTDEFIHLLDTIHTVNKVESSQIRSILPVTEIMDEFSQMDPAPINNWKEIIVETTKEFLKLPPDADVGDIALAAGFISDSTRQSELIISQRIKSHIGILEDIVKSSWVNFFQVIQSYFIVPLQRMLSDFHGKSLHIPIELKNELSSIHINDIRPILENDISLLTLKGHYLKDPRFNLAKIKITYFLKQMSGILEYKNKIRPNVIPGHDITLVYIQRILLYGPLATLLNPSDIPQEVENKSPIKEVGNTSQTYLRDIIILTLTKCNDEKLTFSDKQLKEKIAIRDEKERSNIIAQYSKLSDEERAVELMNQRLGLGKYAVGGTKVIYAYNAEYYDLERQKRIEAGIVEFPGSNMDVEEGYDHADDDE